MDTTTVTEEPIVVSSTTSQASLESMDAITRSLAADVDEEETTVNQTKSVAAIEQYSLLHSLDDPTLAEALSVSWLSVVLWFAYDAADTLWTTAVTITGIDVMMYGDETDKDTSSEEAVVETVWAWTAVAAVVMSQCLAVVSDVTRMRRGLVVGLGVCVAVAMILACALFGSGAWLVAALCLARVTGMTNRALYDAQIPFTLPPMGRVMLQSIGAAIGMCGGLAAAVWAVIAQRIWGDWTLDLSSSDDYDESSATSSSSNNAGTRRVTLGLRVYGGVIAAVYFLLLAVYSCHRQRAAHIKQNNQLVSEPSAREVRQAIARDIGTSHTPPSVEYDEHQQQQQQQKRYVSAGRDSNVASGFGVAVAVARDVMCDRNGVCVGVLTLVGVGALYAWLPTTSTSCSSLLGDRLGLEVVPCVMLASGVLGALCGGAIAEKYGCRRSVLCGMSLLLCAEVVMMLCGFNMPGDWPVPKWLAWFAVVIGGFALGVLASMIRMLQVMLAAPSRVAQMVSCFRAGGVVLAGLADMLVAWIVKSTLADAGVKKEGLAAVTPGWTIVDSWRVVFVARAGLAILGIAAAYGLVDPSRLYVSGQRAPFNDIYTRTSNRDRNSGTANERTPLNSSSREMILASDSK